jgi:predicted PurR-regulated permease PerM
LRLIRIWFPTLDLSLDGGVERAFGWLVENVGKIFSGTANVLLDLFLGIVALFYFLRDGKRFTESFMRLSPLQDRHDLGDHGSSDRCRELRH